MPFITLSFDILLTRQRETFVSKNLAFSCDGLNHKTEALGYLNFFFFLKWFYLEIIID